jgi:hypothetical protein
VKELGCGTPSRPVGQTQTMLIPWRTKFKSSDQQKPSTRKTSSRHRPRAFHPQGGQSKTATLTKQDGRKLREPKLLHGNVLEPFSEEQLKFQLSSVNTYEQYVCTFNSKTFPCERLLPGTYPEIEIEYYTCYQFPIQRMHVACCPFCWKGEPGSPMEATSSIPKSRM